MIEEYCMMFLCALCDILIKHVYVYVYIYIEVPVQGILVATCCFDRITPQGYINPSFLQRLGLPPSDPSSSSSFQSHLREGSENQSNKEKKESEREQEGDIRALARLCSWSNALATLRATTSDRVSNKEKKDTNTTIMMTQEPAPAQGQDHETRAIYAPRAQPPTSPIEVDNINGSGRTEHSLSKQEQDNKRGELVSNTNLPVGTGAGGLSSLSELSELSELPLIQYEVAMMMVRLFDHGRALYLQQHGFRVQRVSSIYLYFHIALSIYLLLLCLY